MGSFQLLPTHLVGQILDRLDSKERARVAVVSKALRAASETQWTTMKLSFATLRELELLRSWLWLLAGRETAGSIREFELFWKGGKLLHPASNPQHIERFLGLEVLRLKPPKSAHWALNARAVERLSPLTNLKLLELAFLPCNASRAPVVTLEEFAAFQKLQDLTVVVVAPKSPVTYCLRLSPKFGGLTDLQLLSIHGLERWEVTDTTRQVVSRLTHFGISIRSGFTAEAQAADASPQALMLEAPNLQQLEISRFASRDFPFCSLGKLRSLKSFGGSLPSNLGALLGLEKLVVGSQISMTDALSGCLAPLQRLKEVAFVSYYATGMETFEGLSQLQSLETITVSLDVYGSLLIAPKLSRLRYLRRLCILGVRTKTVSLDTDFQEYPALRELSLEDLVVCQPISSQSLTSITCMWFSYMEVDPRARVAVLPDLGSLPRLQELELRLSSLPHGAWLSQLGRLPQLQKLVLHKLFSLPIENELEPSEKGSGWSTTLERLLHGLKQLKRLKVLHVVAVQDDVSLSRVTFPEVGHLALACHGVSICPSCLPWTSQSVELIFCTANRATLDLLEHNADVSRDRLGDADVIRARYPWNASLPFSFEDYIFNPREWQDRVDELMLS